MRPEFKDLRRKLLDRSLEPFRAACKVQRPPKGWVRAIREGIGVSANELGRKLGGSRQLVLQQERAEADDRITLKSLRMLANALDCDLVYALVPRADSMQALIEDRARAQAKKDVLGVEHSMALEGQAVGDVEQAIETETRRLTRKRSRR
jgi:predicted DNA-binding mobile mystery protein A